MFFDQANIVPIYVLQIFSMIWKAGTINNLPDICQFWYTTALFRPIKAHWKVHKIAKTGQKRPSFAFSMLKNTPAWKKHTTASAAVLTNISYEEKPSLVQLNHEAGPSKVIQYQEFIFAWKNAVFALCCCWNKSPIHSGQVGSPLETLIRALVSWLAVSLYIFSSVDGAAIVLGKTALLVLCLTILFCWSSCEKWWSEEIEILDFGGYFVF